jgi:hypothetical protein
VDHAYIKGHTAQRGPCPGLNALANHGFLYVAFITAPDAVRRWYRALMHHGCWLPKGLDTAVANDWRMTGPAMEKVSPSLASRRR